MPQMSIVDVRSRFEQTLVERALLEGIDTLLVGCSGGGDSVALAHLLAASDGDRPALVIGHVEHGLRGEESRRDQRRAAALAAELGVEFEEVAAETDDSSEASLRRARLEAFETLVERVGADGVALGHTADDVAETVLLNVARGAGPAGIAALRGRRRVDGLLLVRPLLDLTRAQLRGWLSEQGIDWEEDSTNRDLRYARNRIRHRVLPELEEAVPGAAAALRRLSLILGREEEWWQQHIRERLTEHERDEPHAGGRALDVAGLSTLSAPVRARLLRAVLEAVRGDFRGIEKRHVEAIEELLEGSVAACDLPAVRVRREGSRLRFLPLENRRLAATHTQLGARDAS